MKDGLYIVDRKDIYAAFVVHGGAVTSCAPILRKNLDHWKKVAMWVPTECDPVEAPVLPNGAQEDDPPPWRPGCE